MFAIFNFIDSIFKWFNYIFNVIWLCFLPLLLCVVDGEVSGFAAALIEVWLEVGETSDSISEKQHEQSVPSLPIHGVQSMQCA